MGGSSSGLSQTSSGLSQTSQILACLESVQSLHCVRLFATPWNAARQAFLSITNLEYPQRNGIKRTTILHCVESICFSKIDL